MSDPLDPRLSGVPCDAGGKPATQWFGQTCVRLCDASTCYEHYAVQYRQALEDLDTRTEDF